MVEHRYTLHLYKNQERVRFKSPKFKNRKAAMKWLDSKGIEPFCDKWWTIRRPNTKWGFMYEWMIGCKFKLVPIKN